MYSIKKTQLNVLGGIGGETSIATDISAEYVEAFYWTAGGVRGSTEREHALSQVRVSCLRPPMMV
jgi:hypothetical protein